MSAPPIHVTVPVRTIVPILLTPFNVIVDQVSPELFVTNKSTNVFQHHVSTVQPALTVTECSPAPVLPTGQVPLVPLVSINVLLLIHV